MMERAVLLVSVLTVAGTSLLPTALALADKLSVGIRADSVSLGIRIGRELGLVVIPGTPVYKAPSVPYNYFFYGEHFYTLSVWGVALRFHLQRAMDVDRPRTGATPILAVLVGHYKVRPGYWKRHASSPWAEAKGHENKHKKEWEGN